MQFELKGLWNTFRESECSLTVWRKRRSCLQSSCSIMHCSALLRNLIKPSYIVVLCSPLHKTVDMIFGNLSCFDTADTNPECCYYLSFSWQQLHSEWRNLCVSAPPGHLHYPGQRKLLVTVLLAAGGGVERLQPSV